MPAEYLTWSRLQYGLVTPGEVHELREIATPGAGTSVALSVSEHLVGVSYSAGAEMKSGNLPNTSTLLRDVIHPSPSN